MQATGSHHTRSWHFDNDTTDLARSIAHTLSVQNSVDDVATSFLDHNLDFHDLHPAATYNGDESELYGACWHKGTHYDYTVVGKPEHVARYCDLTAGERESIILTSRRLGRAEGKVFAVATGTYKKIHPTLSDFYNAERLTMCGLVVAYR